jgi:hypothetical protein
MAEYNKTVVPKETVDLRKKLTDWAAFNKVKILDSAFQEEKIRLEGRKVYHRKVRFRVGILFLWVFIGFVIGILFSAAKAHPSTSILSWFGFPLGYVVYYFFKCRGRTVDFEISSFGARALNIITSADFDEVKEDVNSLVMTLT